MARNVAGLDELISRLEILEGAGREVIDAYVEAVLARSPYGTSFGQTKLQEIAEPAGSTMNMVAALKVLRNKFISQDVRRHLTVVR